MYILEGKLVPKKIRVGIVASRFNEFITSRLLSGALDCLRRHEVPEDDITVAWVPGAFEIPLIASRMAASRRYDAVICLGAVIRGSTSHYDYVCSEVSKGIAQTSLAAKIPVMFGVLTTETIEQAIERAGSKAGNKGYECAVGAIEMADLMRRMAGMNFQTDPRSQHMPVFLKLPVYLPCLLINPSFRPLGGNKVDKNRKFLIRFVQIVE